MRLLLAGIHIDLDLYFLLIRIMGLAKAIDMRHLTRNSDDISSIQSEYILRRYSCAIYGICNIYIYTVFIHIKTICIYVKLFYVDMYSSALCICQHLPTIYKIYIYIYIYTYVCLIGSPFSLQDHRNASVYPNFRPPRRMTPSHPPAQQAMRCSVTRRSSTRPCTPGI